MFLVGSKYHFVNVYAIYSYLSVPEVNVQWHEYLSLALQINVIIHS